MNKDMYKQNKESNKKKVFVPISFNHNFFTYMNKHSTPSFLTEIAKSQAKQNNQRKKERKKANSIHRCLKLSPSMLPPFFRCSSSLKCKTSLTLISLWLASRFFVQHCVIVAPCVVVRFGFILRRKGTRVPVRK